MKDIGNAILIALVDTFAALRCLFDDFGGHTRTHGSSTFADSETSAFVHGNGGSKINIHLDVVAGHDHFNAVGKFDGPGHVPRSDFELKFLTL